MELLNQIKEAVKKAEIDPWAIVEFFNGTMEIWQSIDNTGIARIIGNNETATHNAHLIANAPTWLSTLLEMVETKDKEIKDLEAMAEEYEEKLTQRNDEICKLQDQFDDENNKDKEIERLQGMYQRTEDQLGSEIKTSAYLREELEYEQRRFSLIRDKESINDTRIMTLREELESANQQLSTKDKLLKQAEGALKDILECSDIETAVQEIAKNTLSSTK